MVGGRSQGAIAASMQQTIWGRNVLLQGVGEVGTVDNAPNNWLPGVATVAVIHS
jgi:hypothetical protein